MSNAASQPPGLLGLDIPDRSYNEDMAFVPYLLVRDFSEAGSILVEEFLRRNLRRGVARETALRQMLGALEESLNQLSSLEAGAAIAFTLTQGNTRHGQAATLTLGLADLVLQTVVPGVGDE